MKSNRVVSLIFVLLLLCAFNKPVIGVGTLKKQNREPSQIEFIKMIMEENSHRNIKAQSVSEDNIFVKAYNEGLIFFNDVGYLVKDISKDANALLGQDVSLEDMVAVWNLCIKWELITWDNSTEKFISPRITETFLAEKIDLILNENQSENTFLISLYHDYKNPDLRGCACGNPKKNATLICTQNYNEIVNFYNYSYVLSPENAWTNTVLYWISYVREGGQWDYKVHWPDSIYCFKVNGVEGGFHKRRDWFGNYNYGFTGKYLFSLSVLHAGSYAVAGFDPDDVTTDWPAIDLGYSHAP